MTSMPVQLRRREEIAERTLAFHFDKPHGFTFRSGQAVDLILPESATLIGEVARHAFSIASAPDDRELVLATRMRDSAFKLALAAMPLRAEAMIDGPFGSLTLHNKADRAAIFIAGGIGITPFMSMLRHAANMRSARQLVLLYSNRRPEDAAFLDELRQLERAGPAFRFIPTVTGRDSGSAWKGERGRIDDATIRRASEGLHDPVYYVAGPPSMVAALRDELEDAAVSSDDIRSEEFYGY